MNATFAPEALDDLAAVVEYLSDRNPVAAARLIDRVFALVERLAEGGLDGPETTLRSGQEVRSWPVPPFRVYYSRERSGLVILRVYHQAREPIAR